MKQLIRNRILVLFTLCFLFVNLLPPLLTFAPTVKASGSQSAVVNQILFVNSMNNASTQWQTDGNSPYLNNATGKHDIYMPSSGQSNKQEGNFGFPKLAVLYSSLTKVLLYVESGHNNTNVIGSSASVYNASGTQLGSLSPGKSYTWTIIDLTSTFNTITKINQASIYFKFIALLSTPLYIDRMYLNVTGSVYPATSRDKWAQLLWNNDTALKVNATFPFVWLGSNTTTNVAQEELLAGALLSMQTGDNSSLQAARSVCVWLNKTANGPGGNPENMKHVWFTYNSSSGWQTTPVESNTGSSIVQRLAIYTYQNQTWKPLLQQVVNTWIRIFLPLSTARVHYKVYANNDSVYLDPNNAYRDYCIAPDQSSGIEALTLASVVLGNATLKNLAYRMIMNYTNYDALKAPHHLSTHAIYPNGTLDLNTYYFSKEDEDYANYMAAMETFYYYYPQNTTVTSRIYYQAWDGAQEMWNSTGHCWNYKTDIRSGSLDISSGPPYIAVHGFGMTDEVLLGAYLIFGNTTWRDRARQDFDSLVIQERIMKHGLINHSTNLAQQDDAQEAWNVHGRRTAVILYDLLGNQTYLKWANMLFWNVTGQMARKYGLAEAIVPSTGADTPAPNTRESLGEFLTYVNKTVTVTSFHSLFKILGLPVTGIIPPPPPKWISVTLNDPNGKSQTSLSATFFYTPFVVGAGFRNASLWTNASGTWQRVMTDSTPLNLTQNSFSYTYGSYGTYVWNVKVYNSTLGAFANSNYTISLMSVNVSPASVVMDVGQSKLFTSSIVGGFAPFTYQWYLNSAPVSGATGSTWLFTSTSSGSYSVYVNATDSTGTRAKSNVVIVTVNPPPSVTISPTSVVMDVGQSKLFTSSVTGGTIPFSYQWYLNDVPVSGATSSSWTFTPSSPASYTIYVNVTDYVGVTAKSNIASVTVNPPPTASISPTSATMDVGQSKLFTSTVSGGTPPYSYQWYLDGTPVSGATNPTWTFTPPSPSSYTVYLEITDSVEMQVSSNTVTVTVNPPPSVSISPTAVTMDVGQSKLFTSAASGGTSPYSYQWYLNGSAISGATNPTWMFVPSSAASYTVYVEVIDAVGVQVDSNTATVTVNPAPSVSILPNSVVMDVGQSKLFTSTVSGGTTPFSYQWYLDGNPVSGATSATWMYTPSSAGSHTVYLKITDAVGAVATSNIVPTTVNPMPFVTIVPTIVVMDVGQSQLFTSTVSGGTSPYSYQWYLNGAPVAGATNPTWTFSPSSSGAYTVYLRVTDNVGVSVSSSTSTVTVNPQLTVTISPSSTTIYLGQSQTFISSVSGGTSPYSYQWYLNGSTVSGATSSSWTFMPLSTGTYEIYVQVTDLVNVVAQSGNSQLTVNSPPSTVVTIDPSAAATDTGQSVSFNSSVLGGTAPFTYQWYLNGTAISGATSSSWLFTPAATGHYQVYLNATDSLSVESKSNIAFVTVNPLPSATISPAISTLALGQSQLFTSTVSGGTSPYSYQWYLNGTSVFGATNPTWTFTPMSSGFYVVIVMITDSASMQATSNAATVSVGGGIHDVAVTDIASSKTIVGQGFNVTISVSVENLGSYSETFKVTVYVNAVAITSQNITLSSGNSGIITVVWNTAGFAYGNYTISAYAWPVPGETNTANNSLSGGTVKVTIPGDINGDGKVDISDAALIGLYWHQRAPPAPANVDINGDSMIDISDAAIVGLHWQKHV